MKPILPKGAAPQQLTSASIVGPLGMTLIFTGPQASILQTSGSSLTSGTNGLQGFNGVTSLPVIRPAPLPALSNIRLLQVPEEKPAKKVKKVKKDGKRTKDKCDESLSKVRWERKVVQTKTSVKPILPKQETPSATYLILRCAPAPCIVEGPSSLSESSQSEKCSEKKHLENKKNLKAVSKPRNMKKVCSKKLEKVGETSKISSILSSSAFLQNNSSSGSVNQSSGHQQTSFLLQQNIPSHPPPPYPQKKLSNSFLQFRNISSKKVISSISVDNFDNADLSSNLGTSPEKSNSVTVARSAEQGQTNVQLQHAPFRCAGSSDSEKQQNYINENQTSWHKHLVTKSFPPCNTRGPSEGVTNGVQYETSGMSFSNYGYSPAISESQAWVSPVSVHNNGHTITSASSSISLKKTNSCSGMHSLISLNGTNDTECTQAHSEDSNSCQYSASLEIDLESTGHMPQSSSSFGQPMNTARSFQPPPYFSPSLPQNNEASPVPPQTEDYPMLSASLSGSNSASQLISHTPTPPSFQSPPVTAMHTDGYHSNSYVGNTSSVHEVPSHDYTNVTESHMQRPWSPPPYEMHLRHSDLRYPQITRKVMSNVTYSVTPTESSEFTSAGSGVPTCSVSAGPQTSSCMAGSVASPYFQTQDSESAVFSTATVPFTYPSSASLEGIPNFPHMAGAEGLQNSGSESSSYCPSNITSAHHGQPPEYPLHVNHHTLTRTKTFSFDVQESPKDVSPPAYPSAHRPSPQPPPPPPQPPPTLHPPPPPPPPRYVCNPSDTLSLLLPPHSPPRYHARCSPQPVSTAVPLDAHQNLSDTLIDPDSLVLGNSSSDSNIPSAPVLSSPPASPPSVPPSQEPSTFNSNYSWNQCNSTVQLPVDSYPEVTLQAFPHRTQSHYRAGEDVTTVHSSSRSENSECTSSHQESHLYGKQKDRHTAPSFYSSSQHSTHTSAEVPVNDGDISLPRSGNRPMTVLIAAPEKEQIELSNVEKSKKELLHPVLGHADKVSLIIQSEQDRSYEERRQLARKILSFPEMPKEKDAILKENFCIDEDEPLSIDVEKCQDKDVTKTNETRMVSEEGGQEARGVTCQSRNDSKKKKELLCQICGKLLKGSRSLTCHLNSHGGIRPHRCPHCPNAFTNASVLKNHIRIHTGERPYVCTTCRRSFRTRLSLRRHETRHSSARPFHCTLCTKSFKTKVVFQQHIKGFHQRSEGTHKCEVCQKLFSSQRARALHTLTHERPPPRFACSKCPKVYHFRSLLTRHLQQHPEVLKHQCLYCDASFALHGRLVTHLRTHTASHHQCSSCGVTFTSSKRLEIHQRRHSNLLPHKCFQCGKRFQHAYRLAAHRSLHTHSRGTRKNQSKSEEEAKMCTSYSVEFSGSKLVQDPEDQCYPKPMQTNNIKNTPPHQDSHDVLGLQPLSSPNKDPT